MRAREKALELYSTYETYVRFNMEDCSFTYRDVNYTFTFAVNKTAKQCALISVDEIVSTLESMQLIFSDRELILKFWKDVKTEIEKL
jgi:hypothetical protein